MLDTGKYNDICKYEMQWCIEYMIPYDTYCHIICGNNIWYTTMDNGKTWNAVGKSKKFQDEILVSLIVYAVVTTTKTNANVALVFSFLHRLVLVCYLFLISYYVQWLD